jgi:hypothetical protein
MILRFLKLEEREKAETGEKRENPYPSYLYATNP